MFRTYIVRVGTSTHRCNVVVLGLANLYHSVLNLFSGKKQSFRIIGSYVR